MGSEGILLKIAAAASKSDKPRLSHNLDGQRLGNKGRGTRERILAATERLLAEPVDTGITLSAVAREASLGMTTLYLYFSDLTELLLAVLDPIMASAESSYIAHLRERWPDADLEDHCLEFVKSYHAFWERHTRILHLRNSFADANDARMRQYRIQVSQPLMHLLVQQMDGAPAAPRSSAASMATVLLTGIERLITVTTDVHFSGLSIEDPAAHIQSLLKAEARILALGIRDGRERPRA
jgi:AcrR family transcriptional regulator